jgi:hypothetical protein
VVGDIACGRDSGEPDSYGWDIYYDELVGPRGLKLNHYGIAVNGRGKALVSHNTVNRVNKYGIVAFTSVFDGYSRAHDLHRIHDNLIFSKGNKIEAGTHFANVWVSNNTVLTTGLNGDSDLVSSGIGGAGVGRSLRIEGNTITGAYGAGVSVQMVTPKIDTVIQNGLIIENNTISETGYYLDVLNATSPSAALLLRQTSIGSNCGDTFIGVLPNGFQATQASITGNSIGSVTSLNGDRGISIQEDATSPSCVAFHLDPLILSNNTVFPPAEVGNTLNLSYIFGKNIQSVANVLNGNSAVWRWLSSSTGSCSGFTFNGSPASSVTDHSGAVGACN